MPMSTWGGPPKDFPRFEEGEVISLDIETRDPDLEQRGPGWAYHDAGEIIGVSLAWGDIDKGYWPIKHKHSHTTDQFALPRELVLDYFIDLLARPDLTIVVHNAQYDLGWFAVSGASNIRATIIDTGIWAPLIDEHRKSFSLDTLAKWYLGAAHTKNEDLLNQAAAWFGVNPKNEMYRIPSQYVGEYAEDDARVTLNLYKRLYALVRKDKLEAVSSIEHRLIPLLIAMRRQGIRVNQDHIFVLEKRWAAMIDSIKYEFKIEDPWSAQAVWSIAQKRGVPAPPLTPNTGEPSVTKDWLLEHSADEFCANVLKVRKVDKLLNTFLRGALLKHADSVTGRIHPSFHPLRSERGGTVSGRLSSSNPNIQQAPIRGDRVLAIEIRNCLLPEERLLWCASDYSQQEPRLTLHYAVKINAKGAKAAAQRWIDDPTIDYHAMVAEMAGISRSHAKTVNLGLTYGMGEAALANDLGLSIEETRLILKQYYAMLPFIPELANEIREAARTRGYITTFAGRRCRFPDDNESLHAAVNRLIQGSAADQTKLAMLKLWDEQRLIPHVSMHDELDYSVPDEHFAHEIVGKGMETAIKLEVPSLVDVAVGDSWGAAS